MQINKNYKILIKTSKTSKIFNIIPLLVLLIVFYYSSFNLVFFALIVILSYFFFKNILLDNSIYNLEYQDKLWCLNYKNQKISDLLLLSYYNYEIGFVILILRKVNTNKKYKLYFFKDMIKKEDWRILYLLLKVL